MHIYIYDGYNQTQLTCNFTIPPRIQGSCFFFFYIHSSEQLKRMGKMSANAQCATALSPPPRPHIMDMGRKGASLAEPAFALSRGRVFDSPPAVMPLAAPLTYDGFEWYAPMQHQSERQEGQRAEAVHKVQGTLPNPTNRNLLGVFVPKYSEVRSPGE